ncbi:MAG: sugar phosphate nucleotidyltransferase, partial [Candidatus Hermodarchaeota archaeon]
MSPQKNKLFENLVIVILCAGKGTRLKKFISDIPKALIKIKSLNNLSILYHTINCFFNLGANHICIVKGHLGYKIDEFIDSIQKENPSIKENLFIIDSKKQYQLGPLYSFLSLTNYNEVFKKIFFYLLIPGDTFFEFNLMNKITSTLSENLSHLLSYPIIFYRIIKPELLHIKPKSRRISIVETTKKDFKEFLNRIKITKISEISKFEEIKQVIPAFLFSYEFINDISKFDKTSNLNTVRQIINSMISEGKKILAIRIDNVGNFYDIDYKSDLIELNKKKGTSS